MTGGTDGPVFICGAERSGTSLMYALLSSHPRLSMVRRSNMWRWFHNKFGDLGDSGNLDEAIAVLSRYKRLAPLEPDWVRIRREFTAGPPTYGRLFELLHRHHAERLGRERWGDKSLHSEYFAEAIFDEFPDARVIHMVRDPRDRYASIANRYEHESKGIASATGRWLASVRTAQENRRRYPGRYQVVRFEDLLEDPVAVTTQTCLFIGEAFDPEMMEMSGAPEHTSGNSSFGDLAPKRISTAPMGRYRTALRPAEIAFIQLVAGRAMRRVGYALDPVDLRGIARWRFAAVTAPRDACRLAAWSLRQRREQTQERPPAARLAEGDVTAVAERPQEHDKHGGARAVAYVIGTYPLLTTTFIDREVRLLRSWGGTVDVISLRRPTGVASPDQMALAASTTYARPVAPFRLVRRHAHFLGRRPGAYVRTLVTLVTRRSLSLRDRLRTLGHFGLGVSVAGQLREAGGCSRIHAHFIDRAATVAHVAARLLDVPYSVTAHASDIYVSPLLLHTKLAGAEFVATCTDYNKTYLVEAVPEVAGKIALAYHGLELEHYDPSTRNPAALPTLLAVGQLREKKGLAHLLDACRELSDRGVRFRCDIIGEGPQRADLERKVHELGLEDVVVLHGARGHDEVIEAYRRAWVFVLPCIISDDGDRDGIPNVILEAMAMGLPVVSTQHSGIPEVVEHEATGLLVQPADVAALVEALVRVLEDRREAHRMGERGRKVVLDRFDAEGNVRTLRDRFASTGTLR